MMIKEVKILESYETKGGLKAEGGKDNYFYKAAMESHPIETKLVGKTREVPIEILNRANRKRENRSDGIGW